MEYCKKKRSPRMTLPRSQYFTINAPSPPQEQEEHYVLELKPFSTFPRLDFDKVRVGGSKTLRLMIRNPLEGEQYVTIEKFPSDKGFDVDPTSFSIASLDSIQLNVTWNPEKPMSCRETVMFKSSSGVRSQAYLCGTAAISKQKLKSMSKSIHKKPSTSSTMLGKLLQTQHRDKENVDFTFESENLKQAPHLLLPNNVESPSRRQTYCINSIFRESNAHSLKLIPESKEQMSNSFYFTDSISQVSRLDKSVDKFDDSLNSPPNCEIDLPDHLLKQNRDQDSMNFTHPDCSTFTPLHPSGPNRLTHNFSSINNGVPSSSNRLLNETPYFLPTSQRSTCFSTTSAEIVHDTNDQTIPSYQSQVTDTYLENSLYSNYKDCSEITIEPTNPSFNIPVSFEISNDTFQAKQPEYLSRLSQAKFPSQKRQTFVVPKKQVFDHRKIRSSSAVKGIKAKSPNSSDVSLLSCKRLKNSQFCSQRLTLTKLDGGEILQRNPFATHNAFYDEYWMEKQECAFTSWLNFILTPNDDFHSAEDVQVNSAEIWVESLKDMAPIQAPSKEELSFKTYMAAKQLNHLRRSACLLYQSNEVSVVIKKVEKEADSKKLCVRSDRAIHADLGVKKDLLEMLLSYNPLWLRIGLETVYGEIIHLHNNKDVLGLSRFIISRFLESPAISSKFACAGVRHYFKPGYEDAIKSFIVKKFILLVYFLDVAKRSHLIDHNPCLFCKKAKYKSSRDLLITFSREYLSGEGDITRHLRFLGCVVKHEQMPIEEFDFSVKNIAVDLRCGLRLGRVVELLLHDWTISKTLRANTLNRLAKIHNNGVILKALENANITIEGNIDSRDIVDGNREKTLSLLWQIIFKTQVSKKIDLDTLKKENSNLRISLQLKADFASLEALCLPTGSNLGPGMDFLNSKLYKENEVIQELLKWCQYVCAHYGLKVYNFTSSFSDGRALCFILHHYHPNLLPLNLIKNDTTNSYFETEMKDEDNCPFLPQDRQIKSKTGDRLLKNEKSNLEIVTQKLQEIGQVPILSFPPNCQNTIPDDKVIILFVSYINIRLMELSVEMRAGRVILMAYRKWKLRQQHAKLRVQIDAAIIIQKYVRKFLERKRREKREWAAVVFQKYYRRHCAIKELAYRKRMKDVALLNTKATIIQAAVRGYLARSKYLKLRISTIKIQQHYRGYRRTLVAKAEYQCMKNGFIKLRAMYLGRKAVKNYRCQRNAAIIVQSVWRMYACKKRFRALKKSVSVVENYRLGKHLRTEYLAKRMNVVKLQSLFRGYRCRKAIQNQIKAATLIQSNFRAYIYKKRYLKSKSAAVIIQRAYRQHREREKQYRASTVLQAAWRGYKVREELSKANEAATLIQSRFRSHICRKKFLTLKRAANTLQTRFRAYKTGSIQRRCYLALVRSCVLVQSTWRGVLTRRQISKEHEAATLIQSKFRSFVCRKKYVNLTRAAITLQTRYRAYRSGAMQRRCYLALLKSCVLVQSTWRGVLTRRQINKEHEAATLIQSKYRSFMCRKKYVGLKRAAFILQTRYRAYRTGLIQRISYHALVKSCIVVQSTWRGVLARRQITKEHEAATVIQSNFRSFQCYKRYLNLKKAAITVQTRYRAYKTGSMQCSQYIALKKSCIVIQSVWRGVLSRRQLSKEHKAATLIQSTFRSLLSRKRYLNLKKAAITLQTRFRSHLIGSMQRRSYLNLKRNCIILQSIWRGVLARRQISKDHKAATLIQSQFRSFICRQKYLNAKRAALILEAHYRAYKAGSTQRRLYLATIRSCVLIQSSWRGVLARRQICREHRAATLIQSQFRLFICRKKFLNCKSAALTLQTHYRTYKTGSTQRRHYIATLRSCVLIQSTWRGVLARRQISKEHGAATLIQSQFRSFICRKKYLHAKRAALTLQAHYRAYKAGSTQRLHYLATIRSCVLIQSTWRGLLARKQISREHQAAALIQSAFRGFLHRRQMKRLCMEKAAVVLQRWFRALRAGRQQRVRFQALLTSCVVLQSAWRAFAVRREMRRQHEAARVIQKFYREYKQRTERDPFYKMGRQQHMWYKQLRQSVVIFQRRARSYLQQRENAATVIQSHVRKWTVQKLFRQHKAALRIQSVWRAYVIRKQSDSQLVASARRKIKAANSNVDDQLRNRTTRALHILLTDMKVNNMLTALQHLDTCTRLSSVCCERLQSSGGVAILIQLTLSCNRSVPHQEIIQFIANILLNLVKYKKLTEFIWQEEHVLKVVVELMKNFREKASPIFTKCCTILYIFCQDPQKLQVLKASPQFTEKIESFHYLLARKQKLQEQKLSKTAKTVFLKNYYSTNSYERLEIHPEWELKTSRNVEFKDPFIGINTIRELLGLEGKKL